METKDPTIDGEIPMRTWRIAGINFDHMHMGDNLKMALAHPRVEVVGVANDNEERMDLVCDHLGIEKNIRFTDYRRCIEHTKPDIVLLCPATATHGEWTERVAPFGVHIIMEKPFAATLAEADRMLAAIADSGKSLAINWPLAWYPCHQTAKRLIDEGNIGNVLEVHYYDGNRGPMHHVMDKIETTSEFVAREKSKSWFYQRQRGGGSLLDYLGYGTTLGTWYQGGRAPIEVTAVTDIPEGLEVDEHSITIARYAHGLSKFETRWGTFTDPWVMQPQPKCGFVIKGDNGTISSYDYEKTVRLQTRACPEGKDIPVDTPTPENADPIRYVIHRLESDQPIEGPLSPTICRIGQQIVDSAILSAQEKRTVALL